MNLGTYSSHAAGRLASTIESYWHERGHGNVRAERYEIAGYPNHWGVRSNLVGGLPPAEQAREAAVDQIKGAAE